MKRKHIFWEIILWIFIFVIGSLIVTFLVSPESFSSFKENIKSIFPKSEGKLLGTVELVPSQMEEYSFLAEFYKSCAGVEVMGESQGISEPKQKVCREACGKRNMNYAYNSCDKDLLVCYCTP